MSKQAIVDQILALEDVRLRAMLDVDVDRLSEMTSESYVHIESNGRRRNKREFLDDLANATYRFDLFVIDETDISAESDFSLVTGSYRNIVRTAQGPNPMKFARFVRIYLREGDAWRNSFHQATEIQTL